MPDLDVQIRTYIDTASEPLTVDDVLGPPSAHDEELSDDSMTDYLRLRPDESEPSLQGRGGPRILVAVAAAVLVVVGVVWVGGDNGRIVTEPAAVPTVTEPEAAPAPTEPVTPPPATDTGVWTSVDGVTWSPVEEESLDGVLDHPAGTVTVGGPGMVAIGSAPVGHIGGAAWTSVDGLSWSQVAHDETVFGDVWVLDVTTGGPGLVAVGTDYSEDPWSAAVWTSVDGVTWSRVPHDEAVFGGGWMWSVISGGPGLVAVGIGDSPEGDDAAVWTSVDGVAWTRVPHDEAVFGGPHNQEMVDVTVGGPGLVAVGRDGSYAIDNTPEQTPAVWTSTNGLAWSRVDSAAIPTNAPDSAMWSVTAGGPGLVAVGDGIWTSVDGSTWIQHPHLPGQRDKWMVDVTPGGPGLVAVGEWIWTSVDGITWSRAVLDGDSRGDFWSVTAGGPGLVAIKRLE